MSSLTVGASDVQFSLSLETPYPLRSGDTISIALPDQVDLSSTILSTCGTNLDCQLKSGNIEATLGSGGDT